jgi:hypothetical protein
VNCIDGGDGPQHTLTEREFNPHYSSNRVPDNMAAIVSPIQIDIADQEMKQLAEHLAGGPRTQESDLAYNHLPGEAEQYAKAAQRERSDLSS